jgi:hypothetical protein
VSAGAKKRNTLDVNNINTVKAALSKIIYVHITLIVESEQLSVAGRYWANGDMRKIITEHHIQNAMNIKLEILKSEYERAAVNDVFRTGDTSYKQKPTPHAAYKYLYICSAAILVLHSN